MIDKGINHEEFKQKGGLSYPTYQTFLEILKRRSLSVKKFKETNKNDDFARLRSSSDVLEKKPTNNKMNALVLLVDFKDKQSSISSKHFQDLLFSKGFAGGSMRDYYNEVSWNQFDIDGDVIDWYRASKPYHQYVDEGYINDKTLKWRMPLAQKLVKEVVLNADDENLIKNPSKYDYENDKTIKTLIIIHAGQGADRTGDFSDIYPHQGKLTEPIELDDGWIVNHYILMHELPGYDLGGYCHEVGHILGLPDLYFPDLSCTVVGKWCLMGCGDHNNDGKSPAHMSAWCKVKLGWVEPETISGKPKLFEIPAIYNPEKKLYKLEIKGFNGKEYFLVENRQQIGFDNALPGNGLLIWHVDQTKAIDYFPNCDNKHFFITLEQADGSKHLEKRIFNFDVKHPQISPEDFKGNTADIFPGSTNNRSFDEKSNPNSNSYSGKISNINILEISDSSEIMTAVMGMGSKSNKKTRKQIKSVKNPSAPLFIIPKKVLSMKNLEKIKDLNTVSEYEKGYQKGFKKGYEDATDKLDKNELEENEK